MVVKAGGGRSGGQASGWRLKRLRESNPSSLKRNRLDGCLIPMCNPTQCNPGPFIGWKGGRNGAGWNYHPGL